MTRWTPDVCDQDFPCIFDIRDLNTLDFDVAQTCQFHQGLSKLDHWNQVLVNECQAKGKVEEAVRGANPNLVIEISPARVNAQLTGKTDINDQPVIELTPVPAQYALRPGIQITYTFDSKRDLHCLVDGITPSEDVDIARVIPPEVKYISSTAIKAQAISKP